MTNESKQLEAALLGELMLDPSMLTDLPFRMTAEMFEHPFHRHLFTAILRLTTEGRSADLVTLATDRERLGLGLACIPELSAIASSAGSTYHFATHASVLFSHYKRRCITTLGLELQSSSARDADEMIALAEERLYSLTEQTSVCAPTAIAEDTDHLLQRLTEATESGQRITGIETGFTRLDRMTLGLHPSELTILAARPAQGKSAIALTIARHVALAGIPVALFSLEMGRSQLMDRLLMQQAELPGDKVRAGVLTAEEMQSATDALAQLRSLPIYIDDSAGLSTLQLRQKVRKLVHKEGVRLVIIDYLQLMTTQVGSHATRENEVSKISRALKTLAQELRLPIIALSQLNREMERGSEVREPRLSDLRESGAIEQDADMVLMLHDSPHKHFPDERMLILAKQRSGATGNILLRFTKETATFE